MKHLFTIALTLFSLISFGQGFQLYYGNTGQDRGYGVDVNQDGVMAIVGTTGSFNSNTDGYLLILSPDGEMLATQAVGGPGSDVLNEVVFDGEWIIAIGTYNNVETGDYDIYLVRFNMDGEIQNEVFIDSGDWDFGKEVIVIENNAFLITGDTYGGGFGQVDSYIARLDVNFEVEYELYIGAESNDILRGGTKIGSDTIVLVGSIELAPDNRDHWGLWMDVNTGEILQNWTHGDSFDQHFNDVILGAAGNLICVGTNDNGPPTAGGDEMYLMIMDVDGNFIQERFLGGPENDGAYGVTQMPSTELAVVGYTYSWGVNTPAMANAKVYRTTQTGGWQSGMNPTLGFAQDEVFYDAATCPDGGYVTVGKARDASTLVDYVFVLKVDADNNYPEEHIIELDANDIQDLSTIGWHLSVVNDRLEVSGPILIDDATIFIHDIQGRRLGTWGLDANQISLDLTAFANGLYVINIVQKGQLAGSSKVLLR